MSEVVVVLTNAPDEATARALARALVEAGVAACVNTLAPCRSVYHWDGRVEEGEEFPLIIKTTRSRYAEVQGLIVEAHPFDVPEIIALPVEAGLPAYLAWVVAETSDENRASQ